MVHQLPEARCAMRSGQDGRLEPGARPALVGRSASAIGSIRVRTRRILSMARCYAGTVMLEGTTLSEGRGTTRPLELFGAPDLQSGALLSKMEAYAPEWLRGCRLRECWFEPTFHKHAGKLCAGIQIHVDDPRLRSRRIPAVAIDRAGVKVVASVETGLRALAQLCL